MPGFDFQHAFTLLPTVEELRSALGVGGDTDYEDELAAIMAGEQLFFFFFGRMCRHLYE